MFEDDKKSFSDIDLDEGILDLRLGDPLFLKGFWDSKQNDTTTPLRINESMQYSKEKGDDRLLQEIVNLHKNVGNIKDIENKYIVVGAGATQLLHMAMKSMPELKEIRPPRPYWPRFQILANLANKKFKPAENPEESNLWTVPNNPDGKILQGFEVSKGRVGIADLNYNWPHYSPMIYESDADVSIFGLAKLTGHASTRVGWAVVKDEKLAREMSYQVEIHTSGLSIDAQGKAWTLLGYINENYDQPENDIFTYGATKLINRWSTVMKLLHKNDKGLEALSDQGMFLYIKDPQKVLDSIDVLGVSGSACGDLRSDTVRLNLGCSDEDFVEFVRRLNGVLYEV